jgi:cytochrome c oxidase subunit 1
MPEDGFTWMNQVSTVGAMLLAVSTLPFLWNVVTTWRNAPLVTVDDPWGYGNSLEWATSCPPPRHNFLSLPRIRSERPAFDLHHPEVAAMDHVEPDATSVLDWEADRRGQPDLGKDRVVNGTGENEQSSATVIDDSGREPGATGPTTDAPEGDVR